VKTIACRIQSSCILTPFLTLIGACSYMNKFCLPPPPPYVSMSKISAIFEEKRNIGIVLFHAWYENACVQKNENILSLLKEKDKRVFLIVFHSWNVVSFVNNKQKCATLLEFRNLDVVRAIFTLSQNR